MIDSRRRPAVSGMIPYGNAASTIAETIHSAMSQTLAPQEGVVVHSGSTDDSLPQVRGFGSPVCPAAAHHGITASRNFQRHFALHLVCGLELFRREVHDAAQEEFVRARGSGRFDWAVCCYRLANLLPVPLINMLRRLLLFRPFSSRRFPI